MKIVIDESPVGVGKTHRAIEKMVGVPGRYVYAVERVEAIHEMASRIFATANSTSRLPMIEKIFGGNDRKGTVSRQIADFGRETSPDDHCICLITHEAMMMTDFFEFEGWTLIVDEVPSMFATHTYRTPTDVDFFEKNYTLTPLSDDGRWQLVGLTKAGAALSGSSIADCDGHRYLHHFHRRCRDPRMGPVVDLETWADMADGKEWVWWSLFHPDQISAFSHIEFLGNGFTKSVSFTLFSNASIEWEIVSHLGNRPLQHRNARVVYYSNRPTSLFYMRSPAGQSDLAMIANHIIQSSNEPLFWSANSSIKDSIDPILNASNYRLPRQAGSSRLMTFHHAAMFYAAKPSAEVESAISGLGSSADQWVSTNEFETILQFLTRTSARDVTSTNDVVLHVFNREQAEYLKTFFDSQPHITATLERVDLDLSTQERNAGGRPRKIVSAEERQALEAERREKRKLAMRARRAGKAAA